MFPLIAVYYRVNFTGYDLEVNCFKACIYMTLAPMSE